MFGTNFLSKSKCKKNTNKMKANKKEKKTPFFYLIVSVKNTIRRLIKNEQNIANRPVPNNNERSLL